MSNEMLSPLIGSALRIGDREELDEFLTRPDAAHVVRHGVGASARQVREIGHYAALVHERNTRGVAVGETDDRRPIGQYPALGPLSLERNLLHAMRSRRLSPHHLFSR